MSADTAATLSYDDHLPLAWHPLAEDDVSQSHETENLGALCAVAALEEHRELPGEDTPLHAEIHRLHQKMDLLVHMLSSLIRSQVRLPATVPLRLSAQRLVWTPGEVPPTPGARILLELYLHRGLAQPLRLPARVQALGDGAAEAVFEPLGEASLAALERHVFLHHRRSIAGARHAATQR